MVGNSQWQELVTLFLQLGSHKDTGAQFHFLQPREWRHLF